MVFYYHSIYTGWMDVRMKLLIERWDRIEFSTKTRNIYLHIIDQCRIDKLRVRLAYNLDARINMNCKEIYNKPFNTTLDF
jgi:hypothetical protein